MRNFRQNDLRELRLFFDAFFAKEALNFWWKKSFRGFKDFEFEGSNSRIFEATFKGNYGKSRARIKPSFRLTATQRIFNFEVAEKLEKILR